MKTDTKRVLTTSDHQWVPDDSVTTCTKCHIYFTIFNRRHHCRKCGKIFCDTCSNKRLKLNDLNILERVCESCYVNLVQPEYSELEKKERKRTENRIKSLNLLYIAKDPYHGGHIECHSKKYLDGWTYLSKGLGDETSAIVKLSSTFANPLLNELKETIVFYWNSSELTDGVVMITDSPELGWGIFNGNRIKWRGPYSEYRGDGQCWEYNLKSISNNKNNKTKNISDCYWVASPYTRSLSLPYSWRFTNNTLFIVSNSNTSSASTNTNNTCASNTTKTTDTTANKNITSTNTTNINPNPNLHKKIQNDFDLSTSNIPSDLSLVIDSILPRHVRVEGSVPPVIVLMTALYRVSQVELKYQASVYRQLVDYTFRENDRIGQISISSDQDQKIDNSISSDQK